MAQTPYKPPAETSAGKRLSGMSAEVSILDRERSYTATAVVNNNVIVQKGSTAEQIAQINAYLTAHKLTVQDVSSGQTLDVVEITFDGATVTDLGDGQALVQITGGGGGGGNPNISSPTLSDFAWVNQGGASSSQLSYGPISVSSVNQGNVLRGMFRAISGHRTITAALRFSTLAAGSTFGGICLRDSVSGKLLVLYTAVDLSALYVAEWVDPNTYSGLIFSNSQARIISDYLWFRIADDGTNINFQISSNAETWLTIYTTATGTWITPDSAGFITYSGAGAIQMDVVSFSIA